jgi:hypothetical protein
MAVVFRADQEIGRDLTAVDWASTPLGPVDGWPQSLRTPMTSSWRRGCVLRAGTQRFPVARTATDDGTWKTPHKEVGGAGRGRGIVLMRGLMEDFTIDSGDAGTTVNLYARIT